MAFTEPARLKGVEVHSRDGGRIGAVEQVYLDTSTRRPEWVAVKTGWFGAHVSLVPLATAKEHDGAIVIPYDSKFVRNAPHQDPSGQISRADETQLYDYYGVPYGGQTVTATDTRGQPADDPATTRGPGDDAMTRSEERIEVEARAEETGRARLRKYVVTEDVQQPVQVSREEARIEREPITEANREAALAGPDISEAEHEVTLHAERPVAAKRTEPVERVRLTKERVTEEETVTGQVRKEQIDTEGGV